MDKIRYWKKQGYVANLLYNTTSHERVLKRAYNMAMEIDKAVQM